jgi:hypothetical protein
MKPRAKDGKARPVRTATGGPALSDDWRRWIAENLMLDGRPEQIAAALAQNGCPPLLAKAEIERALASPYFQGSATLRRRLAKRDWILNGYRKIAASDPSGTEVPRLAKLPAADFFRYFYARSRPVVLEGLVDHWPAMTGWSLDHFDALLGDIEIEVQTGRESNPDYEMESPKHKRLQRLAQVTARLRDDARPTNDYYVTANNDGHNRQALAPLWDEIGDIPGYLRVTEPRTGFFWMGPRGTITPFHHDLTNNLLLQIRGRKRVTLAPGWETPRMRNFRHCFSKHSSPAAIAALPDAERPVTMECTIGPGDILFIPVGWWHYVEGLDMTIGMSFTDFVVDNDFYSEYTCYEAV